MDLAQANQKRWDNMTVTSHQSLFKSTAQRLGSVEAMARYKAIQAKTGVPWQVSGTNRIIRTLNILRLH